ncbi:Peptidyl-prolyl cis-trans isomerase cyp6 [Actinomortierella ambigua]|nr:Peptidyl-prolyl cis-trans isomerase cyp6 [Actinomortierella ambigua]
MSVLIETSVGDIVIDLHTEQAPTTCLNFLKLCKVKYYNFCCFHNVQRDFMVQTGDPTATGQGGESIFGLLDKDPVHSSRKYLPAEIHPSLKHRQKGTVSMAIAGASTTSSSSTTTTNTSADNRGVVGSQFFITMADQLDYLDGRFTVFGQVAEGMDVLDKINGAIVDDHFRPFKDIRIKHTIVLEDPFPDPPGLVVPDESPLPTKAMLATVRIGEDEDIESILPPEEEERIRREKEAQAQALTLEMVGDLPFAEIKPPENVLFVAQLNPVTRSEDLELIFSRFGTILSCEVIRDKRTGDSLCYAFIEFEKEDECSEAYFKMNKVLIDDRRIHVDFSQSVSKLHKDWMVKRMGNMKRPGPADDLNLEHRSRYRDDTAASSSRGRHGGTSGGGRSYDYVFESEGRGGSRSSRGAPTPSSSLHPASTRGGERHGGGGGDSRHRTSRDSDRRRSRSRSKSPTRRTDSGRERERHRERDHHRSDDSRKDGRYHNRERDRSREKDRRDRGDRDQRDRRH